MPDFAKRQPAIAMQPPLPLMAYRGDSLHDQLFLKVFTVSRVMIGRDWNTRDVCSGYWRLYVNERAGASLALADGARYLLAPGRLHLVPAWVRFSCVNTRPLRHRYAHFDLIGVPAETVQRVFTKPLSVVRGDVPEVLWRVLGEPEAPDVMLCRAKAVIYAALASVLAARTASMSVLHTPGPMAPAVQRIEAALGSELSIGELAALCHLSPDHFGRVFRARLGHTPAQYVLERRIATATQELAFSESSIEQIAERLGFANRFHLTRMFTRRMGIPPAAYRRQTRV